MPWIKEGNVMVHYKTLVDARRHCVGAGVEKPIYATKGGKKEMRKVVKKGSSYYWQAYSKSYGTTQVAIKKDGTLYR